MRLSPTDTFIPFEKWAGFAFGMFALLLVLGSGGMAEPLQTNDIWVNDSVLEFAANAPDTVEGEFLVRNISEKEVRLLLFVSGDIENEEGAGVFDDLSRYVSLERGGMALHPRGEGAVRFSISIPGEMESGRHRAKIVLSPQTESTQVGTKVGVVGQVFVNVQGGEQTDNGGVPVSGEVPVNALPPEQGPTWPALLGGALVLGVTLWWLFSKRN